MKWPKLPFIDNKRRAGFAALLVILILLIGAQFGVRRYAASRAAAPIIQYLNLDPVQNFGEEAALQPFSFDPNRISLDSLRLLGLSEQQARGLVAYREAGGRYRQASDLAKLRGFSPRLINMLLPYLKFTESTAADFTKTERPAPAKVELNTANARQLAGLPGVGEYSASAIIKYREALGGFHSKSQLKEITSLREENLRRAEPYLQLKKGKIVLLNINTVSFDRLRKHPYIKTSQAAAVINYRNKHGRYEKIDDLLLTRLMDMETLERLRPYLSVESEAQSH